MTNSEYNRVKAANEATRTCELEDLRVANVLVRPKPRDARQVARDMASVIVQRVAAGGSCTEADLHATGQFSSAEIIEYADEAKAIARHELADRQIEKRCAS